MWSFTSSGQADLYNCDCLKMREYLADDSVSLTVTSPPYWNAIDYGRYSPDTEEDYRTRSDEPRDYCNFLNFLKGVFATVGRVTKSGGFAAVVVGTVLSNGTHYPLPYNLVAALDGMGDWEFHQDIIWHKCTAGVKRAGVAIQHPYPGYYYPNIMTEYIMVFRKKGPKIFEHRSAGEKSLSEFPVDDLFKKDTANNVWHIAPVPPRHLAHPCPFPEEIPYRLIQLYSYPDDLILDPFAGSGQTLKVANHLGRRSVGFETDYEFYKYASSRLKSPSKIRKQQLVVGFDKVDFDA